MDSTSIVVMIVASTALLIYFVVWLAIQNKKSSIVEQLEEIGAKNIAVSCRVLESLGGRGMTVYDVSYQDAKGKLHETVCMVDLWNADSKIFWEGAHPKTEDAKDDEMEQLMSELMSENAQLRAQLANSNPVK